MPSLPPPAAPSRYRLGVVLMLLSGLSFGCVAILGKLAQEAGFNIPSLLGIRFAVGAVALAAFLRLRGEPVLPARRDLLPVAALGVLGFGLTSALYFLGLEQAQAGIASVLLFTSPAIVALLSRFLGERLGARGVAALAVSLVGAVLIAATGGEGTVTLVGVGFLLASACTYSAYILAGRRLAGRVAPGALAVGVMAAASGAFLAATPFTPGGLAVAGGWVGLAYAVGLGVVGSAMAIGFFFAGLEAVGASRAAILSTVEPLSTLLFAAVLFSQVPTALQLVGAGCVLTAVMLLASRAPPEAAPPADASP